MAYPGTLRAVRFYKAGGEGDSGHVGRVYAMESGALLGETGGEEVACQGPGWVTLRLREALAVEPGVAYVAAVDALQHWVATADAWHGPVTSGRGAVTVLRQGGVRGPAGQMPTDQSTTNYWVDGKPLHTPPLLQLRLYLRVFMGLSAVGEVGKPLSRGVLCVLTVVSPLLLCGSRLRGPQHLALLRPAGAPEPVGQWRPPVVSPAPSSAGLHL